MSKFKRYTFKKGSHKGFRSVEMFLRVNQNVVTFSRKAYRAIGEPKNVAVWFDEDNKQLAVKPCSPRRGAKISAGTQASPTLSNKGFCRAILEVAGLTEFGCRFKAEYDEETNALIFDLNQPDYGGKNVPHFQESEKTSKLDSDIELL